MIQAISFDLWDTLLIDDSDEPKRLAAGLKSKVETRWALTLALFQQFSNKPLAEIQAAFNQNEQEMKNIWKQAHQTPTVTTRIEALGIKLEAQIPKSELLLLVEAWEEMELEYLPDLVPDAASVLADLSADYQLTVISDAIISPGRCLKKILQHYDIARYFSCFTFSDEVGAAKPAKAVFQHAGNNLNLPLASIVHVGDRPTNDILGAKEAGLSAILFTGVTDRSCNEIQPDVVVTQLTALGKAIRKLNP